jgi:hypothetical protein
MRTAWVRSNFMTKISIAKQKTHSNSNRFDNHSQLGLFSGSVVPQSPKPTQARPTNPPRSSPRPRPKAVEIEPIKSEFEGDRYCLSYGDFTLRFELPREQAYELLARTARLDWSLDDRGVPTDIDRIWAAAQQTIEGGID